MPSERHLVDPRLSERKFAREIADYRALEHDRRQQGWFLLDATFPNAVVLFAAASLKPAPLLFAVRVNFDNYDFWAPSVTFLHPTTAKPLRKHDMRAIPFLRQAPNSPVVDIPGVGVVPSAPPQDILIAHDPTELPFLCLPGVREYHEHPAHTGDAWLSHRGKGEGTMFFILDTIYRYGVAPIKQYQFGISVAGYAREGIPT